MKKYFTKPYLKEFLIMNVGTLMVACSLYFFKEQNHFTMGGVGGLCIIINTLVPSLSVGMMISVINVFLLIIGFIVLGKEMGGKTVYCTAVYSGVTWLLEYVCPLNAPILGNPMLELFFAIILTSLGSALLFNIAATTGGTDIISMILKKYTVFDIGVCILVTEMAITVGSGFVYGWNVAAYSIFGLLIESTVVKVFIENLNINKEVAIITVKPDELSDFIIKVINRDATIVKGIGAYTGQEKYVMYSIMNSAQALYVKRHVKELDPSAFVIITNTVDIIGKGFRQPKLDFASPAKKNKNQEPVAVEKKGEQNE